MNWEALMQSVEGPYTQAIIDEKNRYIVAQSTVFPSTRTLEEKLLFEHRGMMIALAHKYQGLAIKLGLAAVRKEVEALQSKYDWDKLWIYLVRKWMDEYGARAAKETANTTHDDLQHILNDALSHDAEFNPAQVAQNLLRARDLSPVRAATIALTEVHNAMMYASVEGAEKVSRDNGVTLRKRWVPVLDERTRINHAGMASVEPISMNADFTVGGAKMNRPGDSRGGAANVIRCRCVLAYEVVDA